MLELVICIWSRNFETDNKMCFSSAFVLSCASNILVKFGSNSFEKNLVNDSNW